MRLPNGMQPRGWRRVGEMCGHIECGAFADLWLGRRRKNYIDFKVLCPMEGMRSEMKRTAGFVVCNRGMVID